MKEVGGGRWVGGEIFGVEKGAEKSPSRGKGCVFGSFPKRLERLILNWCIGGYWFIPALIWLVG